MPDTNDPHQLARLGVEAFKSGKLQSAMEFLQSSLRFSPGDEDVSAILCQIYINLDRYNDARILVDGINFTKTENAVPVYNLAVAYQQENDTVSARKYYRLALTIDPSHKSAINNLAVIALSENMYTEAKRYLQQVIKLDPGNIDARNNMAGLHASIGDAESSISMLKTLTREPGELSGIHSNLLLTLHYTKSHDKNVIFQEHLNWARRYARVPHREYKSVRQRRHQRLRIAYLSPDFKAHSVAYFFIPILTSHDKAKFEVYCYSNTRHRDSVTEHIRSLTEHWRDVSKWSDDALCDAIVDDEIDILVDLAGHTSGNRLIAVAQKPAPVIVSYLGYPDTTGTSAVDYRITDQWADPIDTDQTFTETLLRHETGFLCYQPASNVAEPSGPPITKNGYVTFGSFNAIQKVCSDVVSVWARVLTAVPNSKLLLKSKGFKEEESRQHVKQLFQSYGVNSSRIVLLPPNDSVLDHLASYKNIDIALDTFPYNGTTTTCEALWMGVPVVVLEGDSHVSRVGVSILRQTGLTDLMAKTPDDYVRIAVGLAGNPRLVQHLRHNLRSHLRASNLMNATQFINVLERIYSDIWQKAFRTENGETR